jgi:hypothetical protein
VFRQLVLARIIEPTSKLDALRVLAEVGVETVVYRTLARRLPAYAEPSWRQGLAAACAARGVGAASLVLYDVSTLYFETDQGMGSGARVLQGTPVGSADHHWAAHRRGRVPVDGGGVRGTRPRPRR